MVDFGTCGKCGSPAMPCKCMLATRPMGAVPLRELMEAKPAKSKHIAQAMRVAGWHNDAVEHARLFVAGNYNSEQAKVFWEEGRADRGAGRPCNCRACCRERAEAANG